MVHVYYWAVNLPVYKTGIYICVLVILF